MFVGMTCSVSNQKFKNWVWFTLRPDWQTVTKERQNWNPLRFRGFSFSIRVGSQILLAVKFLVARGGCVAASNVSSSITLVCQKLYLLRWSFDVPSCNELSFDKLSFDEKFYWGGRSMYRHSTILSFGERTVFRQIVTWRTVFST